MKQKTPLLFGLGLLLAGSIVAKDTHPPDELEMLPAGAVKLEGDFGRMLNASIVGGVKRQDVAELIRPFQERRDRHEWRSEFWGKWITSAIAAWRYTGDPALRGMIEQAVADLIVTQTADGYIGAYPDGGRLQRWDIWGRKYVLLGLLAWHEASGDEAALAAARREADLLMNEIGPGRASPFTNDMWSGMASSSVLEPMVLLHRRTGDPRYLDFARYLVESWSAPDGPDLLNKALAGTAVFRMFPVPTTVVKDYGDGGKSKAYEMMSCYEGLAELYRATGDARYLEAVKGVYANIRDTEITLIGSGSDWERWCDGRARQTELWAKGIETCVTVTWMKFTAQMLRLTGDSACVDELERSAFNALSGALSADGSWWCHHVPLAGVRERAPAQCEMRQNCCVANGPRGLMVLPAIAVMNRTVGPVINLYTPMSAEVALAAGGKVGIRQTTDYPLGDSVEIKVDPDQPRTFTLSLRIPAWSEQTVLTLNGVEQPPVGSGSYARLRRRWQPGDVVGLRLDLRARVVPAPGDVSHVAIIRGPLVLARDQRLEPDGVEQPVKLPVGGTVDLLPLGDTSSADIRWGFEVRGQDLRLCDFASAGNTWSEASRYRVWMPLNKAASIEKGGH